MGWRFHKRIKIAPGVHLNMGKKSWGVSVGGKFGGTSWNSKTGTTRRVSIPGAGLSYTERVKSGTKSEDAVAAYRLDGSNAKTCSKDERLDLCLDAATLSSLNDDALYAYWERALDSADSNRHDAEYSAKIQKELELIRAEADRRDAGGGRGSRPGQPTGRRRSGCMTSLFVMVGILAVLFVIGLFVQGSRSGDADKPQQAVSADVQESENAQPEVIIQQSAKEAQEQESILKDAFSALATPEDISVSTAGTGITVNLFPLERGVLLQDAKQAGAIPADWDTYREEVSAAAVAAAALVPEEQGLTVCVKDSRNGDIYLTVINGRVLYDVFAQADEPDESATDTGSEPAETMVWISATGERYHSKPDCGNMSSARQVTQSEASAMGLTACGRCY